MDCFVAQAQDQWEIGPFQRADNAAPVITAQPASVFNNPITGQLVHWEALHTFDPAAVVLPGQPLAKGWSTFIINGFFTTAARTFSLLWPLRRVRDKLGYDGDMWPGSSAG